MKTLLVIFLAASQACEGLPTREIVSAEGGGCPIIIRHGAKGYPNNHPGQWFTATYPFGICAPLEWDTEWEVMPVPASMDICRNSTSLEEKNCGDLKGKFMWIGTPGVYDVTARYRDKNGVILGEETLFGEVVD